MSTDQQPRNIADHGFLAMDDLSDCIDNIARYLADAGYVVQGLPVVAAANGDVALTVEGHSSGQTADLLQVLQTASGTEVFAVATVATAVNGLQVTGSATGNAVGMAVEGSDTNIDLNIAAKGTGAVVVATADTQQVAFYGGAGAVQGDITGALSTVADAPAKAVLTSIIAALVDVNLVTDSTT